MDSQRFDHRLFFKLLVVFFAHSFAILACESAKSRIFRNLPIWVKIVNHQPFSAEPAPTFSDYVDNPPLQVGTIVQSYGNKLFKTDNTSLMSAVVGTNDKEALRLGQSTSREAQEL